jgi:small subunit ribosomal protein S20
VEFEEMAHTPSAKKRAKTYLKQRARNRANRSSMKDEQKELLAAIAKKDKPAIEAAVRKYHSVLDKASKKGTIKQNQAIRKKTRALAAAKKALA